MKLPIFVLTLEGDEPRRRALESQLRSLNLQFTLLNGVDGRKKLPAEYEPLVDRIAAKRNLFREMGDSEIACALSHLSVYREIIENDLPGGIVLEDDISVGEEFRQFCNELDDFSWDILLLYHKKCYVRRSGNSAITVGRHSAIKIMHPNYGAAAYVVSQKMCEILLNKSVPVAGVADWPIDISEYQTYALVSQVAKHGIQNDETSALEHNRRTNTSGRYKRFIRRTYWKKIWSKVVGRRLS